MRFMLSLIVAVPFALSPLPSQSQPDVLYPTAPMRPGQAPPVSPWPPGTLPPAPIGPSRVVTSLTDLEPTIEFVVPGVGAGTGMEFGFAEPPIPDLDRLSGCLKNTRSQSAVAECLVADALPPAYRIARNCTASNPDDGARAMICSTGRSDLLKEYDRLQSVRRCSEGNPDNWQLAQCVGDGFLGGNERYYLGCVTSNKGNPSSTAVCAIGKNLTPEQQVALACAVSTGGQPYAFATCAGGQLLQRELDKCWQNGIGPPNGCWGPNNEYNKFWRGIDDEAKRALGPNSEAYKAFSLVHQHVLAPGPNHEAIKAANVVIRDLRDGVGPNNEGVKLVREFNKGLVSIGKRFGF